MRIVANFLLSSAICVASAAALYRYCLLPYRCNIVEKKLLKSTEAAIQRDDAVLVRGNIDRALHCLEIVPQASGLRMILAANYHTIRRYDDAIAAYRTALFYGLRPEIYFDLGLELIESGRHAEGVAALVEAARHNPWMVADIDDAFVKREVNEILTRNIDTRRNLLLNADFHLLGPSGGTTTFEGIGSGGSSAASQWFVANSVGGRTTTEVLKSTRPASQGMMLHVVTNGRDSGVVQAWLAKDIGPPRAMTSVWVYVQRGQIVVASGNAEFTEPGAFSKGEHRWEHLESLNTTCPANRTVIYSVGGPAAFFIESPAVLRVLRSCE